MIVPKCPTSVMVRGTPLQSLRLDKDIPNGYIPCVRIKQVGPSSRFQSGFS